MTAGVRLLEASLFTDHWSQRKDGALGQKVSDKVYLYQSQKCRLIAPGKDKWPLSLA